MVKGVAYIQTLARALERGEHCILESPTGSGKTLCLLATVAAYLTRRRALREREENAGAADIDELFYFARDAQSGCELVFCPYNYIVDASIRAAYNISLEGAVVVFDEAHNLPQLSMQQVIAQAHSVVITSGTLKPLSSLALQLAASETRFNFLENEHVIQPRQVFASFVTTCLQRPLKLTYDRENDYSLVAKQLGQILLDVAAIFENCGVLVFLPSYAMFFAPFRGKVSEGLSLPDDLVRCVLCVGIPFASLYDLKVKSKRAALQNQPYATPQSRWTGADWYFDSAMAAVNQAAGRVVRHANDYGAVLFVDERYHAPNCAAVKRFLESGTLPNLLFYGPQGTGKTSVAQIIASAIHGSMNSLMVMELNASDDRGIDVVREKIRFFAPKASATPTAGCAVHPSLQKIKLLILDECDQMTTVAQTAIRRIMEVYSAHARFILICNELFRLQIALQSRCVSFRFRALLQDEIRGRVFEIARSSNIFLDDATFDALHFHTEGDM
uniref:Regulator of telomere elongation helicase 1-like n=1 Tax=Dermatophagoides pteronyssinus TaxID=6956 RepID=A0A6P6YKH8_DERPT